MGGHDPIPHSSGGPRSRSPVEVQVLRAMHGSTHHHASVSSLARSTGLDVLTVRRAVRSLDRDGLIAHQPGGLTPSGRAYHDHGPAIRG